MEKQMRKKDKQHKFSLIICCIVSAVLTISGTLMMVFGVVRVPVHAESGEQHVVRFYDNGQLVSTQTVNHGATATLPSNPTSQGYSFNGWSVDGENVTTDFTITADTDFYARYMRCLETAEPFTQWTSSDNGLTSFLAGIFGRWVMCIITPVMKSNIN